LLHNLAFLGDFHPVAVHFPIALLPTAALLRLYGWWRPRPWIEPTLSALLLLGCVSALLAAGLGLTARSVGGHAGELVDRHETLAFATLALLLLATALQLRGAPIAAWLSRHRALLRAPLRMLAWVLRLLWIALCAILRLLLWPLRLLLRVPVLRRLQPRLAACTEGLRRHGGALVLRLQLMAARWNTPPVWANASLAASLLLVLLTGLKGADLSHGEGHLTRNMPPALAAWFGAADAAAANRSLDRAFFDQRVQPLLRRSCVKCHGVDRQQAGLRLDSFEAVIASRVVRWQDPWGSELMRRLLLPRDSAAAMPPPGKGREVHAEDLGTLVAWLQGHTLETLAGKDGGLPADLRAVAGQVTPVEDDALVRLDDVEGLAVRRLLPDHDLLTVNLSHVPERRIADALAALAPYADHVVELSFEGRDADAAARAAIGRMRNLRTLNLSRSHIGDTDLQWLARLQQLRWLNLYGTAVTADAEALRTGLPVIETLYLPDRAASNGPDG
jgi:uncharacterized membrane protein/mono/diheme cytochrome c family protein